MPTNNTSSKPRNTGNRGADRSSVCCWHKRGNALGCQQKQYDELPSHTTHDITTSGRSRRKRETPQNTWCSQTPPKADLCPLLQKDAGTEPGHDINHQLYNSPRPILSDCWGIINYSVSALHLAHQYVRFIWEHTFQANLAISQEPSRNRISGRSIASIQTWVVIG